MPKLSFTGVFFYFLDPPQNVKHVLQLNTSLTIHVHIHTQNIIMLFTWYFFLTGHLLNSGPILDQLTWDLVHGKFRGGVQFKRTPV